MTRTLVGGLKLDSQNAGSTNVNIALLHSNSSSDGFEHMIGKRMMLDDYYFILYEISAAFHTIQNCESRSIAVAITLRHREFRRLDSRRSAPESRLSLMSGTRRAMDSKNNGIVTKYDDG